MAIVLPNGILGNPGEKMEWVRSWMLWNMELLASVDLPGEAFLPQVSVQASCVFLRRRSPTETMNLGPDRPAQRPVFMAIAEACGHGRRGEKTWVKSPDGQEEIFQEPVRERWEKEGEIKERVRLKSLKKLDDDMPWIAEQYRRHVAGQGFEGER